jgi:hypothetical protein
VIASRYVGGMNATTTTVSRAAAAAMIGVHPRTLSNWSCAKPARGPAPIKLGNCQQSRCLYSVREIEQWQRDPAAYEARLRRSHRGPRR